MSSPHLSGSLPQPSPKLIPGIRLPSGVLTPGRRRSPSLRLRNAIVVSSFELEGMRVLDVGCSDGRQSLYLAARAAEVWGIDHRTSQIDVARATAAELGIKNVRFESGDVRDPDLFRDIGTFDLAIAWGFLHRISDIFALFYALEPITNAISLEWRTPVVPMMGDVSIAYHPAAAAILDPMNTGRKVDAQRAAPITDDDKVQGGSAFWEPTPGAVKAMLRRLGYLHETLFGYDELLLSQDAVMQRWREHEAAVRAGTRRPTDLPQARVHMLFEKRAGSIRLVPKSAARARIPAWDHALLEHLQEFERPAKPAGRRGLLSSAASAVRKLRERMRDGVPPAASQNDRENGKRRASYDKAKLRSEMMRQAHSIATDAGAPVEFLGAQEVNPSARTGDIQVSQIDFAKLDVVTYKSRELGGYLRAHEMLPRAVFRDENYYYKIWRRSYEGHRRIALGAGYVVTPAIGDDGQERLWGFHSGLFDDVLCPAFVGGIYNGNQLVGYRTLAGDPITLLPVDGPSGRFFERLAENTLRSGFAYSDVKLRNLVRLPSGDISLVDFDGRLGTLYKFEPAVEARRGVLRPHVLERYRGLMERFADPSNADPDTMDMREKARSMPVLLARALDMEQAGNSRG